MNSMQWNSQREHLKYISVFNLLNTPVWLVYIKNKIENLTQGWLQYKG